MKRLAQLIGNLRPAKARNKSEFVSYGFDELDVEVLAERYREIQALAPKRHERNLPYLFGRDGASTTGLPSNRNEEHLAMALYRAFRKPEAMSLPGGRKIEILDYQDPLKARQGDGGVGKVDLLGLTDGMDRDEADLAFFDVTGAWYLSHLAQGSGLEPLESAKG